MHTDTGATGLMGKVSDTINAFLVGMGTVALIWLVAFFIVSFFEG